jgi:transcriptional regulator with XRE-family HTH domain
MNDFVTEGAPPPPPDVVPESETMEPIPYARKLWDLVVLFDGLSEGELRSKAPMPMGEPWREYVRWNFGGREPTRTKEALLEADRQYFDRGLIHGLERGWLIRKGHKIVAGDPPPQHAPLSTLGTQRSMRAHYLADTEAQCLNLLRTGKARHTKLSKTALRKSLRTIGQQYEIIRWSPGMGHDPIIVDGVTRFEILTKDMGKAEADIHFRELPSTMTAAEVMQYRIELELNSTSKDQSTEARNDYIAALAAGGIVQSEIAKLVALSQNRVSEILSTVSGDRYRAQTPDDDDVAEFKRLAAGGWNQRAIAERTGWSQRTVSNYLAGLRAVRPLEEPQPTTAKRTKQEQIKEAASAIGAAPAVTYVVTANIPAVKAAAKIDPTFIPKFTDADNLRQTLEHAMTVPDLRDVVIDFMARRGWAHRDDAAS